MKMIQGNVEEVRREIDRIRVRNKEEKNVVLGRDIEFNRKILEMKKVNVLVLQHKIGRDKLKERDSGLNQVLCNIARDNGIVIGIDFSEFEVEDKKEKAKRLSRLVQNIRLLKKFRNKVEIINSPNDKLSLSALFRTLGASSQFASALSS